MISLDSIGRLGTNLNRPECVLSTSNGRLYTASWNGGISVIEPDGKQWELLSKDSNYDLKPNGICLMPDNSFLVAHLGAEDGGVYRIDEKGSVSPFCTHINNTPLPPTNYVHLDTRGRVWITISTQQIPRALGYRPDVADGYVVLVDNDKARIVAEGLGYTNECLVHPTSNKLYVNETFSRKLSCFDINDDGSLSNKTTVAEFGAGTFPDGMTFDDEGGIWITSIISNRVIRISPEGVQETLIEDCDLDRLNWIEDAFLEGEMGRPHLDNSFGEKLKNVSSLAFGGANLNTAYLGCLLDDCVYHFKSSFSGYPPTHWHFEGPKQMHKNLEKA